MGKVLEQVPDRQQPECLGRGADASRQVERSAEQARPGRRAQRRFERLLARQLERLCEVRGYGAVIDRGADEPLVLSAESTVVIRRRRARR